MKRKILIRLTALMLMSVMMLSIAGCGEKTATNDGEKMKVTMLFADNPVAPYKEDWLLLQEIEKRANVDLDIQVVPMSDINDKRKIIFNSGELPDLIGYTWPNDVREYVGSGIILPINKYEDKMPNMKKKIEELNFYEEVNNLRELDGNYYVLPTMKETAYQGLCLILRKDIFEKHNIAIPTTHTELYDVLKKLKELYPDSYPMTGYSGYPQLLRSIGPIFNVDDLNNPDRCSYDREADKWEFTPATEEYKETMEYIVKLSQEGLLDPETLTQDRNQWTQKLVSSTSFVTYGYIDQTGNLSDAGRKVYGEDFELIHVLPVAGPDGQVRVSKAGRGNNASVAISAAAAKRDDFDRLIEFVDWLYFSDEGISLCGLGVEGVTYLKEEDGYVRPDTIKTELNPTGTLSLTKDFGMATSNFYIVELEKFKTKGNPVTREYYNTLTENNWIMPPIPAVLINEEDKEDRSILIQKLTDFTERTVFDFVLGKRSIDDWDKYMKEIEDLGYKKLEALINKNWQANKTK
ncbi:MAG: extracellular solute-binding protein [Clostridia bacterium]|nr:extracellular solute-binding protein [Clostridia bacterium]